MTTKKKKTQTSRIPDEVNPDRSITRQRRWQKRKTLEGKCQTCGEPSQGRLCVKHTLEKRRVQRKRQGYMGPINAPKWAFYKGKEIKNPGASKLRIEKALLKTSGHSL